MARPSADQHPGGIWWEGDRAAGAATGNHAAHIPGEIEAVDEPRGNILAIPGSLVGRADWLRALAAREHRRPRRGRPTDAAASQTPSLAAQRYSTTPIPARA